MPKVDPAQTPSSAVAISTAVRPDDYVGDDKGSLAFSVRDLVSVPSLRLEVAAGEGGLDRRIKWVATTEVDDPGVWLEAGTLLLVVGHGVGGTEIQQRLYVRRLAEHRLAGLGFGVGFRWDDVPGPLLDEADAIAFPILRIPYEIPFLAINKVVLTRVAERRLRTIRRAQDVSDELVELVLSGENNVATLLRTLAHELRASVALRDSSGVIVAEAHSNKPLSFEHAVEFRVPVSAEPATLLAVNDAGSFDDYGKLVLHHGVTALAFELSRRYAVSAAELRLAGDLFSDLERGIIESADIGRRLRAFGLEPGACHAALAVLDLGQPGIRTRIVAQAELARRGVANIATVDGDRVMLLVAANSAEDAVATAQGMARNHRGFRIGVGRPATGSLLGQSIREAIAALAAGTGRVSTYDDLGSLGLLLSLPSEVLEAYAHRMLGPVLEDEKLTVTLTTLLEHGGRVLEASQALGIHRHTMRNRIAKIAELTGRDPDHPIDRMDLWLAVHATTALDLRTARRLATDSTSRRGDGIKI